MTPGQTTFSRITLDIQPPIARITLHNPPLNIIDLPMMDELAQALADVERNPAIIAIILAGSQQAFSAGVDVAAHTPENVAIMLSKFHAIFHALVGSTKVSIAAVRGHCLGGGAELAMICDLVYTSETATWGFPEIMLGCYPPVATTVLSALVGHRQAADLILTGRSISGREAANIGLANAAIADAEVETAVQESIDHLVKLSPAALSVTKKAMYGWHAIHFDKGLARSEKIYLEELMKTEDAQEGIAAFMEKRDPKWKGN
ncbi:MAG TPA: enoyl-CoA hydratase/isomerase family protein [Terriglobales bacterium]|nr:enoyl-CoA hydratase/isomerase family protein [Terriglobales bacterium]